MARKYSLRTVSLSAHLMSDGETIEYVVSYGKGLVFKTQDFFLAQAQQGQWLHQATSKYYKKQIISSARKPRTKKFYVSAEELAKAPFDRDLFAIMSDGKV